MNRPYTYLIGWPEHNFFYYGVRYKNGCCSTDFFTTYFTSSRLVHECIIKYGMPPVQQIRKEFDFPKQAMVWEQKVLRRIKVLYNNKWLNKNISGAVEFDEGIRALMSIAKKGKVWVHKNNVKALIRKELLTTYFNNGYTKGHGQKLLGQANPMFGKQHNDETRNRISKARKGINTNTKESLAIKSKKMTINNPMFDPITKEKHAQAMKLCSTSSKAVYYGNTVFASLREANKHNQHIKYTTLAYKCANKKDGWSYEQPSLI